MKISSVTLLSSDNATSITAAIASGTDVLKGTLSLTAFNGVVTFTDLYYTKAELITLGFSSSPALTTAISSSILVGHAPVDHFVLNAPADFTAGASRAAYIVTRYDVFNNLVNTNAQTVYLFSSSTGLNKKFYNAASSGSIITQLTIADGASSANFWYYDEKTGTHTITASESTPANGNAGIIDAIDLITVTPTLLKDFLVYGVPDPHDLGTWQSVTVEARDTYNNLKTNYIGRVTFSSTDFSATIPADHQFLAEYQGVHTFVNLLKFSQPGSWWITALDWNEPQKYGAQANIIVQRAVSIVANNRFKTYGDDLVMGTSEFTVSGIVPGVDPVPGEITGVTLTSDGSDAFANVDGSPYIILTSAATGPYNPIYYRIEYSNEGKLTVDPAELTITADLNQTKVYGEADPIFTFAAVGFKNGQDESILSGFLSRVEGETVGLYAILQGSIDAGTNYSITFVSHDFSITAKPISIYAISGQNKIYGSLDPTLEYTADDLAFTDVFVGALGRDLGEDVASDYAINIGSLTIENGTGTNMASNYTISFNSADFAITPLAVDVTADAGQGKIYGDLDPVFTYTSDPTVDFVLPNGDAITFSGSLDRATGESVGLYAIGQGDLANTNYTISFTSNDFTIGQLDVTVIADANQSKVYGQIDPTFTYTSVPAVDHELPNGDFIVFSGSLDRESGESVGNYSIGIGSLANANYSISYTGDIFEITQLGIQVTADPGQTKIYGQLDPTFTYTSDPAVNALLPNGDHIVFTGALEREEGENVGLYEIELGSLANTNYSITYNSNDFEITQLAVSVTADAGQTKIYGEVDPTFTYTSAPLVGFVLENGLLIGFTGNLDRIEGEDVGNYAIGMGNLDNTNYSISFNSADFAITALAVDVTADAGQGKIYGDLDPVFTYTSDPAVDFVLPNGDAITFSGSLDRATGESVGLYAIGLGNLANTNYTISFTSNEFTIGQLDVTVTADANQSKIYGELDPAFTYSSVPAVDYVLDNGIHVSFSGSLDRMAGEDVGTYAIGQGSLDNDNFSITYTGDLFEITQLGIQVTADPGQNKIYGQLDPTFTYTSDPAVNALLPNGDHIVFTGNLVREEGEIVGLYEIGLGSLDNSNYSITYTSDDFEIIQLAVTLTANAGQTKVYGQLDPAFTYTSDPLVGFVLENGLLIGFTGNLDRVEGEDVNAYAILQGTADNSNYNISFNSSNFTITKLTVYVTADIGQGKVYGQADPVLTYYTYPEMGSSLPNGAVIAFTGSLSRVAGETVLGSPYPIGIGTLANSNYSVIYASNNFVITKLGISGNFTVDATRVYDGGTLANVLSRTLNGLIGTDDVQLTGGTANYDTKHVGVGKTVTLTGMTLSGADYTNYNLTGVATTTADITAAHLSVTAQPDNRVYDGTTESLVAPVVDALQSGDVLTYGGLQYFDTKHVGTSKVLTAEGVIINDGNNGDNYQINYVENSNGVITTKSVSVAAQPDTKNYDGTVASSVLPVSTGIISPDVPENEPVQVFDNPNVGTGKILTASGLIVNDGNDGNNYSISYVSNSDGVINTAALTITADDKSKTYDGEIYSDGYTAIYNGFVNGEDPIALTGTLDFSGDAMTATEVGAYTITPEGFTSVNYSIAYIDGALTINLGPHKISGVFTYYNISNPDLAMDNVNLSLMQGETSIATTSTDLTGHYEFLNIPDGIYSIEATTTKPSGGINATDAGLVNYWWIHRTSIERVKWNAGDFSNDNYINATDAGQIRGYFVNGTPIPTQGTWTFWKAGDVSDINPPASTNTFTVAGTNFVQDYYALCVADFNRSYMPPTGTKLAHGTSSIRLINDDEPILAGAEEEINLPIRVTSSMKVGAISLILNFPEELLSIEGVALQNDIDPSTMVPLEYSVKGNELRIGWNDLLPVDLSASECLLTLKIRTTANFTAGHTIMITMVDDQLNELADDVFEPMANVLLVTKAIEASSLGINDPGSESVLRLETYPNPFYDMANIVYSLPSEGEVMLDVTNMYGARVEVLAKGIMPAGTYYLKLYGTNLNPGVYTLTLTTIVKGHVSHRVIKIVRGW